MSAKRISTDQLRSQGGSCDSSHEVINPNAQFVGLIEDYRPLQDRKRRSDTTVVSPATNSA